MRFTWETAIFIFFAIFISLCIAFIVFALHQNQDLVEDDYYNKGAGYTIQMEINKRSLPYGDSLKINLSDTCLSFNISKYMTTYIDTLNVYFFRPSGKHEDYRTILKPAGSMMVSNTHLKTGRYIAKISWFEKKKVFMLEKEIIVK